jgi:hypothetical protein
MSMQASRHPPLHTTPPVRRQGRWRAGTQFSRAFSQARAHDSKTLCVLRALPCCSLLRSSFLQRTLRRKHTGAFHISQELNIEFVLLGRGLRDSPSRTLLPRHAPWMCARASVAVNACFACHTILPARWCHCRPRERADATHSPSHATR